MGDDEPTLLNPLNAELNPICHLLALLGPHHILHISRIRVKLAQGLLLSPPSLYGDRWTIGHLRLGVESYTDFRFEFFWGVRVCYSLLSRLLLWLTRRLGRTQPRSSSELRRRPRYILVLNLVIGW
jgi:hypothetical protein